MTLWLKHMAVRLWTALFLASLTAMMVLPRVAGATGPDWMIVPGVILFIICFWLVGWIFAAWGRRQVDRLLGEAAVWERAGMDREARQVLTRAESAVDSFFFSPFSRRLPAGRLLAHMARFQLAGGPSAPASETVVAAYLRRFPRDREAAAKWLEGLLAGRAVTRHTHDIAVQIGTAHPDDVPIQRMLAQFYLAERRCDFVALNTYRAAMGEGDAPSAQLVNGIADLFLSNQRADNLALKAYLAACAFGSRDQRLLPGLAACCRLIHPTPLTLPLLEAAEGVLAGIGPSRRKAMAVAFMPDLIEEPAARSPRLRQRRLARMGTRFSSAIHSLQAGLPHLGRLFQEWAQAVAQLLRYLGQALFSKVTKWILLGAAVIAFGWLAINTVMHLGPDVAPVQPPPPPSAPEVKAPVTDPFTLQVAAFLKEADARRFVDQLKEQGLDVYWLRATSGNKTWFQVRVSHFKTKDDALAYGEDLKNRQIIGDYYVANYKRPDAP